MAKYLKYTAEHHAFIAKHQADIPRKELAKRFNAKFGTKATTQTMNAYCRNRKLKSNSTGRFDIGGFRRENTHTYTQEQRDFIVKHQAYITRKELAKRFNARFGTSLTKNQMVWYCHTHKLRRYNNANPGSYVPIGSIHKGGKKQLHIKVCDGGWMPLHRYNYIKAYGPIPEDHTIRFIDGDSFNCEPENLLAVPRFAQGAINATKTYKTDNAEVNKATMLTAALNTAVNRKSEEANHGKTKKPRQAQSGQKA